MKQIRKKPMSKILDEELDAVTGGTIIVITIEDGDTLGALAKKFRCSVDDLCRWNDIKDPNVIQAGQKLKVYF